MECWGMGINGHGFSSISIEYPEIPIFTIHDSIVTKEAFVPFVYEKMKIAFTELIGMPLTLEVEFWKEENNPIIPITLNDKEN
jgi:hypothetical protein